MSFITSEQLTHELKHVDNCRGLYCAADCVFKHFSGDTGICKMGSFYYLLTLHPGCLTSGKRNLLILGHDTLETTTF